MWRSLSLEAVWNDEKDADGDVGADGDGEIYDVATTTVREKENMKIIMKILFLTLLRLPTPEKGRLIQEE